MRHRARTAVLGFLSRRVTGLPLRLEFWDGEAFAFGTAPSVTLRLGSALLMGWLLRGNIGRLAQAYVEGELTVEGRLQDVLLVGAELAERIGRVPGVRWLGPIVGRLGPIAARLGPRHTRRRDAADIGFHYDVSNAFYELWLDRNMVYSCAYFERGDEDIDTAQEQKLEHICRKLRLSPGQRLLDIGCGWGGLLRWAAVRHGVDGVGVTLSERQAEYARALVAAEGLEGRIEIRLQDYRDMPEREAFDRVVSVGMYEHVGLAKLPEYFACVARALKPGGVALNHGITTSDREGRAGGPPGGEFIDRYVFPGGELPHLSRVIYEVAGAGLEFVDAEDLRPHYAQTLVRWVERLEARREAAIAAAGAERFRVWRMYMAGMAYAFDRGLLSVDQVVAVKPGRDGPGARPWTRGHQYGAGVGAMAGRVDWGEV